MVYMLLCKTCNRLILGSGLLFNQVHGYDSLGYSAISNKLLSPTVYELRSRQRLYTILFNIVKVRKISVVVKNTPVTVYILALSSLLEIKESPNN